MTGGPGVGEGLIMGVDVACGAVDVGVGVILVVLVVLAAIVVVVTATLGVTVEFAANAGRK